MLVVVETNYGSKINLFTKFQNLAIKLHFH